MFFLHRIWNWCSRFRHRCGYGVHSPSDFFLITSVVYEKYHYYAYRVLKERGFPAYLPHYRRKVNRLLFRLVNYFRPKSLIEVGIGNGAVHRIYAGCVSYYGLRHLERQGLGKDFPATGGETGGGAYIRLSAYRAYSFL